MNGCKNVTDESIEAIVQFCPNINILLFHGCPNLTGKTCKGLLVLKGNMLVIWLFIEFKKVNISHIQRR